MSSRVYHTITETGQITRCSVTEQIITNPEAIFKQLIATAGTEEPAAADPSVRCLYNLGDGVSAFRKKVGSYMIYWNSIQLGVIPFNTIWELCQDPKVNDGKHYLCPWDGVSENSIRIGAPMYLPVPDDLIIHFHIEYRRSPAEPDIQLPEACHIPSASAEFIRARGQCYLTCFSISRNTCLMLPLPNLFEDGHLCTGNAFERDRSFFDLKNHTGLVTSTRSYLKTWSDAEWNLDLLQGAESEKMARYRRFVRFDAASGSPLPYSGCTDWPLSASSVPLEDVYRPWIQDRKAVQPVKMPEEEPVRAEAPAAADGAGG